MTEFKSITERYCHIMGKNVPVEISYQGFGLRCEECLRKPKCVQERGNCTGFNQQEELVIGEKIRPTPGGDADVENHCVGY